MANFRYWILVFLFSSGCYSHKKSIESSLPYSKEIAWPVDYEPSTTRFFVHNEIDIKAKPERVWKILIQAEEWPQWYVGDQNVSIKDSKSDRLKAGTIFTWKTMGLNFTSEVKEFEAPYRLSWESRKNSIKGYHAWLIVPTEAGCKLITDESQYGWLTFMQKTFIPNKLWKQHNKWLMEIKKKAEVNN
ncbi:MAG: SRPBCC domain-containing protein [Bacteroidota bacterium]